MVMKTPDEIKKGLECCIAHFMESCNVCPYAHVIGCARESTKDALAYIRQLEAERDQAVKDLTEVVQEYGEPYCELCGADIKHNCTGRCWTHNEGFKWRGLPKEDL